jgi:hypothetical protein
VVVDADCCVLLGGEFSVEPDFEFHER